MDASTTSARIDKLDGAKFHVWKFKLRARRLRHLSRDGGLAAFVGAIVSRRVRSVDEVGHALREEESCEQAFLAWTSLHSTFMEDGDGVLEHIKLRTLAEQLGAVGAPFSDEGLVITLLSSLNDSFQFLITALESRSDELT
ncbi:unnamed protein product [Peronospora destructor]|uniref:Uncharacterized protein n=1 Tax=Peronospora destructor TaxID=86335 RepID=A0AAV0V1Z6_9STRA|nr:unnamed protein product [Peronospora destructor]